MSPRIPWLAAALILSAIQHGSCARKYECMENYRGEGVREDECESSEECSRPVPCTCPAGYYLERNTGTCEIRSRPTQSRQRQRKRTRDKNSAMSADSSPSLSMPMPTYMQNFMPPPLLPPPPPMPMYPPYPMMQFMPPPLPPPPAPPVYIFMPSISDGNVSSQFADANAECNNKMNDTDCIKSTATPATIATTKRATAATTSKIPPTTKSTTPKATTRKPTTPKPTTSKDTNDSVETPNDNNVKESDEYIETEASTKADEDHEKIKQRRRNKLLRFRGMTPRAHKPKWSKPKRKNNRQSIPKNKIDRRGANIDAGVRRQIVEQNYYPMPQPTRRAKVEVEKSKKDNRTIINQNLISINNYGDHVSVFLKRLEDQAGIMSTSSMKERLKELVNTNKKRSQQLTDFSAKKNAEPNIEVDRNFKMQLTNDEDYRSQPKTSLRTLPGHQIYRNINRTPVVEEYETQPHFKIASDDSEKDTLNYKQRTYSEFMPGYRNKSPPFEIFSQDGNKRFSSELIPTYKKKLTSSDPIPKYPPTRRQRFEQEQSEPKSIYRMQATSTEFIPNFRNQRISPDVQFSEAREPQYRLLERTPNPNDKRKNDKLQINTLVRNVYLQHANKAKTKNTKLALYENKYDVVEALKAVDPILENLRNIMNKQR